MNIELTQGSPEWFAHRAKHYNASEAAAMLGISQYLTRSELVRQTATGSAPEIDAATQRRFDDGHAYEAAARPWAEEIIGEELFPVTVAEVVNGLPLSASLDGLTMDGATSFEHKTMNEALDRALADGKIPEEYHPQCEQGLLLSGATRCLFMASRGDKRTERHAWYESNPALRAKLLSGWAQFRSDVAAYEPDTSAPAAVGKAPTDTLPYLAIQVSGSVLTSNLPAFKERAIEVFRGIKTDLQTDEDFADAELAVKFCKGIEDRLEGAKRDAMAQTASIDALFKAIDEISEEARQKRLTLDKAVKSRKESIRLELIRGGELALAVHVQAIDKRLGKVRLPPPPANFAGVIKGLKTLASIKDAIATELARTKIEASEAADRIGANLRALHEQAGDYLTLFPDVQALVLKAEADLTATIKARIADHLAIRQREQAKREAEAVARREEDAKIEARRREVERQEAELAAKQKAKEEPVPPVKSQPAAATIPVRRWAFTEDQLRVALDLHGTDKRTITYFLCSNAAATLRVNGEKS